MIKPKYIVALCTFAFFTLLAFMSTGISFGNAQPAVSSAVAPSNPVTCGVGVPDGSVVGIITQSTALLYGPNAQFTITSTGPLNAGSKWFVVGQDATHKFYKIYISCGFVWVPVNTMAPSPDGPAAGLPLPTRVVS